MTTKRNRHALQDGFPVGIDRTDAMLHEALRDTFPASDPVAISATKAHPPAVRDAISPIASTAATSTAEDAMATAGGALGESTIYGGKDILVEQLLPVARARLVTIAENAPLLEAARLLRAGTDLVVVCGIAGAVVGVITKTDVVAQIGECQDDTFTAPSALLMSADVLLCAPRDLLRDVWSKMKARGVKNVPIVGADGRPLGVLNARDALGVLLQEVKDEESLLRDYVMGVGYR